MELQVDRVSDFGGQAGAEALVRGLEGNVNLESLDLKFNNNYEYDGPGIRGFVEKFTELFKNSSGVRLQNLNFEFIEVNFDYGFVECFRAMLKVNSTLLKCGINDVSLAPFIVGVGAWYESDFNMYVDANNLLHKSFPFLSEEGIRELKRIVVEYLDKRYAGVDVKLKEIDYDDLIRHIKQTNGELFLSEAALAVSGGRVEREEEGSAWFRDRDLKNVEDLEGIAEEAEGVFVAIINDVGGGGYTDQHRIIAAQKMFHIHQSLALKYEEIDKAVSDRVRGARSKSIAYLIYSYGYQLALSGPGSGKVYVLGLENVEVILKASIADNCQEEGVGGVVYRGRFKTESDIESALEYLKDEVVGRHLWMTGKYEALIVSAIVHLFGKELIESLLGFKGEKIVEIEESLGFKNAEKRSIKRGIESTGVDIENLKLVLRVEADEEKSERIVSKIKKAESDVQVLMGELVSVEQDIEKLNRNMGAIEHDLDFFVFPFSGLEQEEFLRFLIDEDVEQPLNPEELKKLNELKWLVKKVYELMNELPSLGFSYSGAIRKTAGAAFGFVKSALGG